MPLDHSEIAQHLRTVTGKDIADIIFWVASMPSHVNINSIEVMPVCQTWAPFAINRSTETDQEQCDA